MLISSTKEPSETKENLPLTQNEQLILLQRCFYDTNYDMKMIYDVLINKARTTIPLPSEEELLGKITDKLEIGNVLKVIPAFVLSKMLENENTFGYIPKEWQQLYKDFQNSTLSSKDFIAKSDKFLHPEFYDKNKTKSKDLIKK
jgi:hypothetical protein